MEKLYEQLKAIVIEDDLSLPLADFTQRVTKQYIQMYGMPARMVEKPNYCVAGIMSICGVGVDHTSQKRCGYYQDHSYSKRCRFCMEDIANHCDNHLAQANIGKPVETVMEYKERDVYLVFEKIIYERRSSETGAREQEISL